MIFSKTCNYAIRAGLYVAASPEREVVSIREISEELKISFHFLTKILQKLTKNNILTSRKGPKGGVTLNKAPKDINLKSIIVAIDGIQFFEGCILGLDKCDDKRPCPVHDQWQPVRRQIMEFLEETTLDQFETKMKSKKFKTSSDSEKRFDHPAATSQFVRTT